MANSVVPSFHGCPKFILSDSPSATATAPPPPPPHLSLLSAAPRFPSVSPLLQKSCSRNGFFPAGAEKVRRKDRNSGGGGGVVEMEGFDGEDGDEDEDEDEDEMLLPLGEMKDWLESKPRGFGVGKVYDTSVEEKLLEEIEQSREAQAANLNKLKNNPVVAVPKKDNTSQLKVIEETPSGIRVRVSNLPKKRNVHRDLKLAFQGTSGILNIAPAVSGNSKTRDPVCKGFAFVYFKLEKDAVRFVQTFPRQSISFGKVQKQIKCEVVNPRSSLAAVGESESKAYAVAASRPKDPDLEGQLAVSSEVDDSVSDSWEDLDSEEESDLDDDDLLEAELGETNEEMGNLAFSELVRVKSMDRELVSPNAPSSSERQNRGPAASTKKQGKSRPSRQKPSGKGNGAKLKVPKLQVPGSAKRLKIKEKAMLNGVFSKYGAMAANAVNEES